MYNVAYNSKSKGYPTYVNNKITKCYNTWRSMITRCYGNINDSYKNCHVCKEWLDYQNFAEWYNTNIYDLNEPICLDKDLIGDSLMYSPSTCLLIPETINKAVCNLRLKGELPLGVSFHKGNNKYVSYLSTNTGRKTLGYFEDVSQAEMCYLQAKQEYVINLANTYKGVIPSELYTQLTQYKVRRR